MGRLFWKFFLSMLLAHITVMLGVGVSFWLRDQGREQPSIDTSAPAEFLTDSATATLRYGGSEALHGLLCAMKQHSLFVVDESGHEMLNRPVRAELIAHAERLLQAGGARSVVRKITAADGHRYLFFVPGEGEPGAYMPSQPGQGPGNGERYAQQNGAQHPTPSYVHSSGFRFPSVALMIGAALSSLLLAALLAWNFSRPIRALRNAFEAASAGDLSPRFSDAAPGRGDELSALGRDFDRMGAQLRALMEGQRQLLHDVSHELRSPLARMQAAIGLAHQQPDKTAASLERIERESVRMDKLVGELLTLARLEAAAPLPMSEGISVADLIDAIAADARYEGSARQVQVAVSGEADVELRGAPDLLWRAIENVVRNAVKLSPDGATVEIVVHADRAAGQLVVEVLDRGPGIAQQDLQAIFHPFFRANPSNSNTDGHGLGLAIARRVAEAHGGSICASNRTGGGLTVQIMVPIARA